MTKKYNGTVARVPSQVRRFLEEFFCGCAAFHKKLERAFRRAEPVRRLQRVRTLNLIGAVRFDGDGW